MVIDFTGVKEAKELGRIVTNNRMDNTLNDIKANFLCFLILIIEWIIHLMILKLIFYVF